MPVFKQSRSVQERPRTSKVLDRGDREAKRRKNGDVVNWEE